MTTIRNSLVALTVLLGSASAIAATTDQLAEQIGVPSPLQRYSATDPASEPLPDGAPDPSGILAELAKAKMLADAGKATFAEKRYRELAARVADDAALRRRVAIALGQACALRADYDCALAQWNQAGQSAEEPPQWLPASYAYALWGLGRHEQALAWYDVAVLGNAQFGNSFYAGNRFGVTPLNRVARAVFAAWSEQLAPLRKAVLTSVQIDPQGNVARVQLLDKELDPRLAQAVQAAVAGWHFDPTLKDGQPATLDTYVFVEVRGRSVADGGMKLDIQYAGQGPIVIKRKAPRYPLRALQTRTQGVVMVAVEIAADGSVSSARLAEGGADPDLQQAALEGVRQWRFSGPRINGEPVTASALQPIVFSMAEVADSESMAGGLRQALQQAHNRRSDH